MKTWQTISQASILQLQLLLWFQPMAMNLFDSQLQPCSFIIRLASSSLMSHHCLGRICCLCGNESYNTAKHKLSTSLRWWSNECYSGVLTHINVRDNFSLSRSDGRLLLTWTVLANCLSWCVGVWQYILHCHTYFQPQMTCSSSSGIGTRCFFRPVNELHLLWFCYCTACRLKFEINTLFARMTDTKE